MKASKRNKAPENPSPYISPRELAERWRCSWSTVDRIAKRAAFTRVCLGTGKNGMVWYLKKEIEAYETSRSFEAWMVIVVNHKFISEGLNLKICRTKNLAKFFSKRHILYSPFYFPKSTPPQYDVFLVLSDTKRTSYLGSIEDINCSIIMVNAARNSGGRFFQVRISLSTGWSENSLAYLLQRAFSRSVRGLTSICCDFSFVGSSPVAPTFCLEMTACARGCITVPQAAFLLGFAAVFVSEYNGISTAYSFTWARYPWRTSIASPACYPHARRPFRYCVSIDIYGWKRGRVVS